MKKPCKARCCFHCKHGQFGRRGGEWGGGGKHEGTCGLRFSTEGYGPRSQAFNLSEMKKVAKIGWAAYAVKFLSRPYADVEWYEDEYKKALLYYAWYEKNKDGMVNRTDICEEFENVDLR